MKVLSLKQPWAMLVAMGVKRIETRSWATKYRGPLLIHASQRVDKLVCKKEPFCKYIKAEGLPVGAIIASCRLIDCVLIDENFRNKVMAMGDEFYFGDYSIGRYAWILDDMKMLDKPVPAKGQLGLWGHKFEEGI